MMRWFAAMGLCLLMAQPVWAIPQDAQDLVKNTADEVLGILKERKQEFEADPRKIYDLVNEVVIPHFDFVRISRYALGRNWDGASKKQLVAFIKEFRTLLVRTYAKALIEYTDQTLTYLPLQAEPDAKRVVVRSEVSQPGGAPIPISYSLVLRKNVWKVYDIKIDGISLVANYRSTFASEISQSGLDQLIAKLAERNAQAKVGE